MDGEGPQEEGGSEGGGGGDRAIGTDMTDAKRNLAKLNRIKQIATHVLKIQRKRITRIQQLTTISHPWLHEHLDGTLGEGTLSAVAPVGGNRWCGRRGRFFSSCCRPPCVLPGQSAAPTPPSP